MSLVGIFNYSTATIKYQFNQQELKYAPELRLQKYSSKEGIQVSC